MSVYKRQHPQYSPDWESEIKGLVGKEVDKLFKKDEIKPDGTKVTKDEGETIKVNEIEHLLTEIKNQKKAIEDKLEEIVNKRGYKDEAKRLYKAYRELKDQVEEWKANDYSAKYADFLGTGSGTKYRTDGWLKLVADYNKKLWINGSTATNYTNLYSGKVWEGEKREWISDLKITEPEALKLITQILNVIGKVKVAEFHSALTNSSITAPTFTGDLAGQTVAQVKNWFDVAQKHAKTLLEVKNEHRTEYNLGNDGLKKDGNFKNDEFTKADLDQLWNLLKFFHLNSAWLEQDEVKKALTEVSAESEILIRPAQDKPYTQGKLYEWGVEGYTDDNFANSATATNFYGTDPDWNKARKIKIKFGLPGWSYLVLNFFDNERAKFTSSFTGTPYRNFLTDIRTLNEFMAFQTATTGSHDYTYLDFPEYLEEAEDRLTELETEKDAIQTEIKEGRKELLSAEKDYDGLKKSLQTKKTELENKIKARITELRQELKTKYKVSDTQTPNFGNGTDATDNNRITQTEHYNLRILISDIRFLENGDEEKPTGKKNEDDAYQISVEISDKVYRYFNHVAYHWKDIIKPEGSDIPCKNDEERIEAIKSKKSSSLTLSWCHSKFEELAKLVKLEDWQISAQKKLKAAIDNQTPAQNNQDWRNTLKSVDSGLETALTEERITRWKEKKDGKEAFNNLASLKSLLEKVCVKKADGTIEKIADNFITTIKKIKKADGTEAGINTLSELIAQKEPVEVIKLIIRYEYDQLAEIDKKNKKQKLVWTLGKKGTDGKYLADGDLTEEEITNTLYEIAIGKKTEALSKPVDSIDQPGDKNNGNNQDQDNKNEGFFRLNNPVMWVTIVGAPLAIAGIGAIIWWDKISCWWKTPVEPVENEE